MARIKQAQRKNTGGWAPRKSTSVKEPRKKSVPDTSLHLHDTPAPSAPHPADTVGLSGGSNFNWDLIEVSIDVEVLDPGTIWLPMINLKPKPAIAYAWHQFDLEDLKKEYESELESPSTLSNTTPHMATSIARPRSIEQVVIVSRSSALRKQAVPSTTFLVYKFKRESPRFSKA